MTPRRLTPTQIGTVVVGVLLVLAGFVMPQAWYDNLPTNPDISPPRLRGVALLQGVLVLQGVLLIGLGWLRVAYVRLDPAERLAVNAPPDAIGGIGHNTALRLLGGLTLFALLLRCLELGSDFWIDEVRATIDAREMSTLAVLGSYVRSNVHILNTLLMKVSMAAFGESEWSARLPVVLFGTATVPAFYWASRLAASREVSLGAALLLTVSYHHVFFSQNARGYVLYIFFSLVSSALFVQGLRDDRARTWVLYSLAMVLNFSSILISGFVFAAHILVGIVALGLIRRQGASPKPLFRRLLAIFGLTGLLGFQLYSVQLPHVIAYIDASYANPVSGYALLSMEFLAEMARGLSAGFGPGLLLGVLPFLLLAAIGFLTFLRRQWTLAASLTLPLILTAALLILRGLTVSPRFFLLGLPVAILTAVLTVELGVRFGAQRVGWGLTTRRRVGATVVILLAGASLASLGPYYAVPKQPFRASLEHATALQQNGDVVVAIHTAVSGSAYYGPRFGLVEGRDLFLVSSLDDFEEALPDDEGAGAVLVTSMPRALHIDRPELEARIRDGWEVDRTFPATIGDGQISVWTPRAR